MPRLKLAVLVPDGAADLPIEELGMKTPLEIAETPNMDSVAETGFTGTAVTIPEGMPPGSDVANLSLLGYDPQSCYGGRGPIEAANIGVTVPDGYTALRCNLVYTDGDRMIDYSAGHVSQEDASRIIEALQAGLGDDSTRFFQGRSYRNIVLLEGDYRDLECTPPHDITGQPLAEHLPRGPGRDRIIGLMERSRKVLAELPENRAMTSSCGRHADMIWLWGQGVKMELEPFEKRFGMSGVVISAVDLVNGLGKLLGLRPVDVPGITGYLDTNYRGKGEAAVRALSESGFVYVHVEAPDEASHMGDVGEKIEALEKFDSLVAGPVLERLAGEAGYRIMVCPDHPTLISSRTHDASPVPFAVCGTGIDRDSSSRFSEEEASRGGPHIRHGWELMLHLTGRKPWPGFD